LENSFVLRGELLGALMLEKAVKKLMNIEKKLIACSILAITIGIATIMPLALVMSSTEAQPNTNDQSQLTNDQSQVTNNQSQLTNDIQPQLIDYIQPQFAFNMSYAYIRDVWDNSTLTDDTYGWAFALAFTTSPNFDVADLDSKVIFETYRAELTSEKGSIGNITLSTFATPNTSPPMNFSFYINQWYNLTGNKECAGRSGSNNGTSTGFRNGADENWDLSTGEPQTLTITVYRDNCIFHSVNSTEIYHADPEVVQQFQLQKYGNGFLYNTAIPQNELDTINPMFPALKLK
jgi:hypothetical protein